MSSVYDFVSNDTGSVLQVTCRRKSDNTVINLTGATVTVRWKDATRVVTERTMTLTAPLTGIATYQFAAGELFGPEMSFEVEILDTLSKRVTMLDPIVAKVRSEYK